MPQIQTTVVGANFRPTEARAQLKMLTIGDSLELEAEPDNEYDSCAVKVLSDSHHVGYIPRTDNGPIFAALEQGEELTAEIIAFESAIKPVIEINIPEGDFEDA